MRTEYQLVLKKLGSSGALMLNVHSKKDEEDEDEFMDL